MKGVRMMAAKKMKRKAAKRKAQKIVKKAVKKTKPTVTKGKNVCDFC